MVKQYQETARFVHGALDVAELQQVSPFIGEPQKFSVQRALVLSDADYRQFVNGDFRKPPAGVRARQHCMGFDAGKRAWNCLLVVSEVGQDGILVGKAPDAERYYMAYVPDHGKLNLPAGLPVEFGSNVCTTTLRPAMDHHNICHSHLQEDAQPPKRNTRGKPREKGR